MKHNEKELTQEEIDKIYAHAAHMLSIENKSLTEVKTALIELGFSEENSTTIVDSFGHNESEDKLNVNLRGDQNSDPANELSTEAINDAAKKDMLYGALWCVGGTVLTIAEIGYVFWGAIIFGGYQFLKGAFSLKSKG